MDAPHYNEMVGKLNDRKHDLAGKSIFLFGHCEASLVLSDLLLGDGHVPAGILDNNEEKHGQEYKGIAVMKPESVLASPGDRTCVLVATRFYEAMNAQLRRMGFTGDVIQLANYNSYAEYSLSGETRERKYRRVLHGKAVLGELKERSGGAYLVFCPFNALGDIYFCLSYLPAFAAKRGFGKYALCVPSGSCEAVARLFGAGNAAVLAQDELDAAIQAVIYTQDEGCFIAHQDRPYVVNLHKALKLRPIPLEKVYCCGVFGLPEDTVPVEPNRWMEWENLDEIEKDHAVILSPYAKSVTALPSRLWDGIIEDYKEQGYQIYTNISGEEEPLNGTMPLRAELSAMRSVLERAGTFIGIRSGLCDVVRTARCRKIALYPDYYYCDTRWKAIDMYAIAGFENLVVEDGESWEQMMAKTGKASFACPFTHALRHQAPA